jgi:hypothetical protein
MAIIGTNPFGAPSFSLSAESSSILQRFRNDTGDSPTSQTYSIGQGCNQDSDCAMGNMCVENTCYYKCDTDSDCPFWHTCRNDIHSTQSVCGSHTATTSKSALPTKRINPATSKRPPQPEEEGFFQKIYGMIFG